MNILEFETPLQDLACAWGMTLKAERVQSYFKVFKNIAEYDWRTICDRAKLNAERFPSIKELCVVAYDIGAFGKQRTRESIYGSFQCACGEWFAFNKQVAASHPEYMCDCPMKFYDKCNRSYAMGYMLKNEGKHVVYPKCKCGAEHVEGSDCEEVKKILEWIDKVFHKKAEIKESKQIGLI
jgi:hypothetical protein